MNCKSFARGCFSEICSTISEVAPEAGARSDRECIKVATLKVLKDWGFGPVSSIDPFSGLKQVCCLSSPFLPLHSVCAVILPF